jgi:hypothetical protein
MAGKPAFFLPGTAFFFQSRTKKKARKKKSNGQLLKKPSKTHRTS